MNTQQRTEEKVFSYIEEHHMLAPHDRVVAGISGGADSVCLLFVLLEWAKKVPLSLAVVHVNHGIRAEAERDLSYVEKLCREQGISFYPYYVDVREKAAKEGCSEEEAGRLVRYQVFAEVAEKFHANKIAVAHNSNDCSETMLFHLFRGSGIRGLAGIRPVRDQIIRPILCLERREVEAYLEERRIAYCQDATNEEDDYTRNRIRHHILPYAEQEIAGGCVAHMAQTAAMLAQTEDYLEQQTAEAMKICVSASYKDDDRISRRGIRSGEIPYGNDLNRNPLCKSFSYTINIAIFMQQHKVIQKRMLYVLTMSLAPGGKDITYTHIQSLQTLFSEKGNRRICLPFGIVGRRQYDVVILTRCAAEPVEAMPETPQSIILPVREKLVPGDTDLWRIAYGNGEELELRVLSNEDISADFPQNRYTKWFDYDKIKQYLVFRTRQVGDYLTIAGKDGQMVHKSVKDYMITEKIPRGERDQILLLAEGQHVIWLMGYRISEYYKIDRNTKHILQVQLKGKKL